MRGAGKFADVPSYRMKNAVVAAVSAALLLGPFTGVSGADDDDEPMPPDQMSNVGGERLGQPGTQVELSPGAPALPKKLTARSWIVADAENGQVLAAHNAHWKLAPASTLKMLFADTLLPKFPKTQEHKVLQTELENLGEGSSLVGIKEDETYLVKDLWLGVFLRSGNDAVHVLTEMNGGKAATVAEMNEKAKELGAEDTKVVEPDGYDAPGQTSSAYDLTLFARSGMTNADFREYAATPDAKFPGEKKKGKKRETFEIQSTNRLLTGDYDIDPYKGLAGIKNGNTTEAGATFTGVAERDGKVLLVTVMHPQDGHNEVYHEAEKLLDWGFKAGVQAQPVGELVAPADAADPAQTEAAKNPDQQQAGGTEDEKAKDQAVRGRSEGGIATALWITGGSLALLALLAVLVRRRWPLPAAVRYGSPAGAVEKQAGHEAEPEQKGDGDAEGSVDTAGGDTREVATEKQLEKLEAKSSD